MMVGIWQNGILIQWLASHGYYIIVIGPTILVEERGPPGVGTMLPYIKGYLSLPWPLLGCCPSLIALRQHIEGKRHALELFKIQEIILLWGSRLFKGLFQPIPLAIIAFFARPTPRFSRIMYTRKRKKIACSYYIYSYLGQLVGAYYFKFFKF